MKEDFERNEDAPTKGRGYNKYKKTGAKDIKPLRKGFDYDKIKSNNIIWWNKNKEQFNEVTKVPTWPQIQGRPYLAGPSLPATINVPNTKVYEAKQSMPGIMVLEYIPSIGVSESSNSPVNKAFNILMSALYSKTSGSSLNFQQGDLAKMIITMASIASGFGAVKRMLGCKDFWLTRNAYYPKTLSQALGNNDYDDMVKNFNSYVTRLDDLIARFNSIKIPSWFDIFARHYSLAKNVYLDEDSEIGQLFLYKPVGLWKYHDVTSTAASSCELVQFTGYTVGDYLDIIEDCLDQWLNSSDLYLINGALLRAFPDSAFIMVEPFNPNDRINAITDTYLAMQNMNATICGDIFSGNYEDFWTIDEDVVQNAILFEPKSIIDSEQQNFVAFHHIPSHYMLRMYQDSSNADENMEMTRLSVVTQVKNLGNGKVEYKLVATGTEVIVKVLIYSLDRTAPIQITSNALLFEQEYNKDGGFRLCEILRAISPFRFFPRIAIAYADQFSETDEYKLIELGDQYQYTTISSQNLIDMHTAALYSVWKPLVK